MKRRLIILFFLTLFQFNGISQSGWDAIPLGTSGQFNSIHFVDQFDLYICGDVLLNATSPDSGSTWQVYAYQPPIPLLNDIAVIDDSTIITVGNNGTILRSTDGGISYTIVNSGVSDNLLSVSFVDSFGICGGSSQTILYTSNSGASWNIAQSGFFGGGFRGAVMLSPQIGFVAGENSIFQPLLGQTPNSGQSWNFTSFYLDGNEGRATGVDFTDQFTGYVSARVFDGRGAIAKTTDAGSNWTTTFFNNPLWSVDFPISGASQVGYAAGDSGVILKTYDAGNSWQQLSSGTTSSLNKIYFSDFDTGYAVGENGILLRTTTGGEPVTKVKDNSITVDGFSLFQNYPNPFNPTTNFGFRIADFGFVSLKVYDVLGNEVTTLINEKKQAGEYEIKFNANHLPSGVYFYRLTAGSFSQIRKMILMR